MNEKGVIKPLQSFRFFFALMVFASHLEYIFQGEWIYEAVFSEGFMGVSFFFLLSGFIISYNYERRFQTGSLERKEYYLARIGRIYPLHILCLILSVPLVYRVFDVSSFVLNLGLFHGFFTTESIFFSFNEPSWSLSAEVFFYLLFPFLVIRKGYIWFTLPVLILILIQFIPSEYQHSLFYINPFFRLADFIIGMLVFRIWDRLTLNLSKAWATILELASVLVFLLFFVFHSEVPIVYRYSSWYWIPVSIMILIFSYQKGMLSELLSIRPLVWLGEISFGIYLFHQLVLRYFDGINRRWLSIENEWMIAFISLAITILISHLSYMYFEKPVNRWIRSKGKVTS